VKVIAQQAISATSTKVSTPNGAAKASLSSIDALEQAQAQEKQGSGKLKKAVAAALLGVALVGAGMSTANAENLNTQAPQTSSMVMTHEATGPPHLNPNGLEHQQRFERFLQGSETTTTSALLGSTSAPVDARTKAAFDQFTTRLTQILHQDAGSLAWGHRPLGPSDTPTPDQDKDVQRALKDLIEELPVGAFGPKFESIVEGALGAVGNNRDLSTTRLKDLGRVGGDAAEELLKEFRREHPAGFYTAASVVAAGALAYGYTEGTDALERLGIRPEVRTTLFDGVKLRVGVHAGPKFSDPALTLGLSGNHTFASGTVLRGGVQTRLQGGQLGETRFDASITTTSGFQASGQFRTTGDFKPIDTTLSATKQFDRWNIGASTTYTFDNDRFTSTLSAGRTFDVNRPGDLDLQIRGSHDSKGGSFIGIGATFRW